MKLPKTGSLERIVLEALMEAPNGLTYLDFPEELGITEQSMDEIVERLRTDDFDTDDDPVILH